MNWYWWRRRLGLDHARRWRQPREDVTRRPRVLLESPDGAEAQAVWSLLDRHGYDTMWCPGPSGRASECSLVRTGRCPLVDGADLIVNALDRTDGKSAEVARRLDASTDGRSPSRPVVVVTTRNALAEVAASLPHCDVVPGPLRSEMLLRVAPRARPTHSGRAD